MTDKELLQCLICRHRIRGNVYVTEAQQVVCPVCIGQAQTHARLHPGCPIPGHLASDHWANLCSQDEARSILTQQ